ncbi:transcriptional regulator, TetR family [Desulfuromonas acetoxidans DSM 684]|uniref:Transcriptional regulator, TetR family n=2 Tax=Desulfuromonas acetoxidans TaxID=891 RepID=Q1K027_DESA6|nr:TetR/AcrR family transcriptional regulator [Desulfuromonas acetoxidans]EAT15715.1 transcriptional regulator, TetR family [Desulfuromonas acetoxidans DSM 684]
MAPMGKGDETRQRILRQTSGLFNTKGYYSTTLSEIMQATGLKKGGLYNHFASKEDLALEVFHYNVGLMADWFHDQVVRQTTWTAKLRALYRVGLAVSQDEPLRGGCPILNASIEADDSYPPLKQAAVHAMQRLRTLVISLLEGGMAAGEFRADCDVEQVASFVLAAAEGSIFLAKLHDSLYPAEQVVAQLDGYLESLRPR